MSKSIAFLAGLGTGYFNSQAKKKDDERRDKRDARDEEIYQEGRTDRQSARDRISREDADKAAIRAAAAPVGVQETPSQPMPAEADSSGAVASTNPTVGGYKVGAKTFAERGIADTEAAAQNTPEATRQRVTAAMLAQGDVLGAYKLETSGLQAKAANMAIKKGERDEANAVFDQGIRTALQTGGPQALAQFMSESQADGQGGSVKFQAVMAPDGKSWQMNRVGPDGAMQPFGQQFGADEAGMAMAGMMLSRSVGDDKKVAHLMAVKEALRKEKNDADSLGIQQQNANTSKQNADTSRQNADTNEQYRKDQAANMKAQRALEAERIKAIQAGQAEVGGRIDVSLKDIREFESDFAGRLKDLHPIKDGANDAERSAMSEKYNSLIANGVASFRESAMLGIPLTTGTVIEGLRRDAANKASQKDGKPKEFDTGTVMGKDGKPRVFVMVGDAMVIVSGPMQKKPAAPTQATVTPAANSVTSTPAQAAAAAPVYPQAPVPTNPASATALGRFSPTTASGFAAAQFK